ncbi:hypothetical protein V6N13_117060 [Hibiscus sabdariffa]
MFTGNDEKFSEILDKLRFDMSGGKKGGFIVSDLLHNKNYLRWPNRPEVWIEVTKEYNEKMMGLACKLLEVLSKVMGLEKEALTKACVDMDQKVVVNFYPKCP